MPHSLWMPIYWADYLADTTHLTTFQHGSYLLLIAAYWQKGGPISGEPTAIAQMCKTTPDKVARWLKPVLAMFTCQDGLLHHQRIEKELLKSSNRQASAVANGRAGGLAKSKLPHSTPTITKEQQEKVLNFSLGKGRNGVEMTEQNKLSLFHNWLAPLLGENGWVIIARAMDPTSDGYQAALDVCKHTARINGKGWPHQWPKRLNGA